MRAVLDTNVLARAIIASRGPAAACVDALEASGHVLLLSSFIVAELRRILAYPRLRAIHGRGDDELEKLVADLADGTEPVVLSGAALPGVVVGDPDDEAIVATAVLGKADVLCTLDRDLRHPAVVEYCATRGVRVLTDVELLALLRAPV